MRIECISGQSKCQYVCKRIIKRMIKRIIRKIIVERPFDVIGIRMNIR